MHPRLVLHIDQHVEIGKQRLRALDDAIFRFIGKIVAVEIEEVVILDPFRHRLAGERVPERLIDRPRHQTGIGRAQHRQAFQDLAIDRIGERRRDQVHALHYHASAGRQRALDRRLLFRNNRQRSVGGGCCVSVLFWPPRFWCSERATRFPRRVTSTIARRRIRRWCCGSSPAPFHSRRMGSTSSSACRHSTTAPGATRPGASAGMPQPISTKPRNSRRTTRPSPPPSPISRISGPGGRTPPSPNTRKCWRKRAAIRRHWSSSAPPM